MPRGDGKYWILGRIPSLLGTGFKQFMGFLRPSEGRENMDFERNPVPLIDVNELSKILIRGLPEYSA